MNESKKIFNCRLSENELETLRTHSACLGMTQSEYVRHLINIPVSPEPGAVEDSTCIVMDSATFGRIYSELVRWGRHYNQAVRALNTISLHIRRKGDDKKLISSQLKLANEQLAIVREGRDEVQRELAKLESLTLIGE